MSYESMTAEAARSMFMGNPNDTYSWKLGKVIPGKPQKPKPKPKHYSKRAQDRAIDHWRALGPSKQSVATTVLGIDVELVKCWSKERTRAGKNLHRQK